MMVMIYQYRDRPDTMWGKKPRAKTARDA